MAAFCRDCLARHRRRPALPRLLLAAHPAPCRARHTDHLPCRLRRLLRHHREARRPDAGGQAADHRRRQARRRVDRLLHRANLRHPLGDADVRGAAALSARHHRPPQHGEIRRRQPPGARADARYDAAGRADLDRRGFHGSRRHRAAARHERRQGAGAVFRAGRKGDRHHRLDRARRQQVPGQDRLRPRQAARLRRAGPGRGRRVSSPTSRCSSSTASARSPRLASPRTATA